MLGNLPTTQPSTDPTSQAYDQLYSKPLELDPNTFNMMKGFFEGKGFDKVAAETVAVTFIKQAKNDGYNPLEVLDTLRGMKSLELNTVVTEILNYNRYKTSYLGHSTGFVPFEPVARNIQA